MSRSKSKAVEAAKKSEVVSKPKKGGLGRGIVLLGLGAIIAMVVSADLRSKVLDALFGAEEEFDYTSTTAPSTPAPAA